MRKLFSMPFLAFLLAISPALASPHHGDFDDVPSLVEVSRLASSHGADRWSAVPSLRPAPSAFPDTEQGDSDKVPPLILSSVAGDPLDHHEARNQLQAATRSAQRDMARQREVAESSGPVSPPAPLDVATGPSAAPVPPQLEAIAACESGGDPSAVGGGGAYRGKYQFSPATWQALGGSGDPAAAPEAEQDRRAAVLYAQSGASQWPSCGG